MTDFLPRSQVLAALERMKDKASNEFPYFEAALRDFERELAALHPEKESSA